MTKTENQLFEDIKDNYGNIAALNMKNQSTSCCGDTRTTGTGNETGVLSLGCYTNLVEKAQIKPGEIVVDLGSGPAHNVIQAAEIVGDTGKVIGVDMTIEMLVLGKKNTAHLDNVEIVEGNLQQIPLPDNSVDVIISNCVFNLAPNKAKAFAEAFRVLKPGGKIVESDVAIDYDLSDEERNLEPVYSGCIGGAEQLDDYVEYMKEAGFIEVQAEKLYKGIYTLGGKPYEYDSILFSGKKDINYTNEA